MTLRILTGLGLALLVSVPAVAQPDSASPQRQRQAVSAERLLGMRARLGLTEQQVRRLNDMRRQELGRRQQEFSARLELPSRLRAGEITRDQFLAERTRQREALRNARRPNARDVLTDEQRERIGAMRRDLMRQQGRMQALRGMRGQRDGVGRGMRRPPGPQGFRTPMRGRTGPGPNGPQGPMVGPRRGRPGMDAGARLPMLRLRRGRA